MKVITTENASATQTEHPWRATVRTLIQTALGAGIAIAGILVFVPGALDEFAVALGDLGIVIPAAVIALPPVIARIMAIPGVEKALRKIGAGAAPAELTFGDWTGAASDEVIPVDEPDIDDVEAGADAEPEGLADQEAPEPFSVPEYEDDAEPEGYQPRH